jgi:prepilin-type N-terminal cleavage/methylation domain-containing protein
MSNFTKAGNKKIRGFSLVEILVAVVIITLAILPVLTLSRSDNFSSSFNEGYLLALNRGKRISSEIEASNYRELIKSANILTAGGSGPLTSPLPQISAELTGIFEKNPELSYLKHHEKKLSTYKENLVLKFHEKGLLSVETTISWTIPGENNKMKEHHCKITTFVTDSQNTGGHKIEI